LAITMIDQLWLVVLGFLAIGSFIGGLVGARLSLDIKERYLQILVSVVILIAAAKLFFDSVYDNSTLFGF